MQRIGRTHDCKKILQKYVFPEFLIHSVFIEHFCVGVLLWQPRDLAANTPAVIKCLPKPLWEGTEERHKTNYRL